MLFDQIIYLTIRSPFAVYVEQILKCNYDLILDLLYHCLTQHQLYACLSTVMQLGILNLPLFEHLAHIAHHVCRCLQLYLC